MNSSIWYLYLPVLRQQVLTLNCLQWLPRKYTTNWSKYTESWGTFCMQLCIYNLYEFWIRIICNCLLSSYDVQFLFCLSELMFTKCIENVSHISANVCIQFACKFWLPLVLLILVCRNVGYFLYSMCIKIYKVFTFRYFHQLIITATWLSTTV